jgi:hypothetical protein
VVAVVLAAGIPHILPTSNEPTVGPGIQAPAETIGPEGKSAGLGEPLIYCPEYARDLVVPVPQVALPDHYNRGVFPPPTVVKIEDRGTGVWIPIEINGRRMVNFKIFSGFEHITIPYSLYSILVGRCVVLKKDEKGFHVIKMFDGVKRPAIKINITDFRISDHVVKNMDVFVIPPRLIPLSQVGQYLGLAGQIQNGAGFEFFGS